MKTRTLLTQKEKALMSTGAVKRATRTRPSGALFGSVGVLLLLVAGVQGSGPASDAGEGAAAAFECTNATIQGTYGIQIQGTRPVPPPLGGGTETLVGVVIRTYDGAGSFTQIDNVKGSVTGITPDRVGAGHVSGELELLRRDSRGACTGHRDRGANGDRERRRRDTLRDHKSVDGERVGRRQENRRRQLGCF